MINPLSLYELNNIVHGVIEDAMDDVYWVQGELSEGRAGYAGHFYGELIQKDERTDQVIARARINIWARVYNILALRFKSETGQELHAGMKVLLKVKVTFHELYGYALNVLDIDSAYTLGDMAKRRQQILQQLEADGIINDNKILPLPRLIRHIAVVSSATAAGYGDFCDQLLNNDYGLHFDVKLFPAVMQGEHVEESIIEALEQIGEVDIVVIIRGGGASADLSDFDSYPLASCIAQYPIPVIVGIGHERDETVLDYVAHTSLKTPTAVAAFIIDYQLQELMLVESLQSRIQDAAQRRLEREKLRLERHRLYFPMAFAKMKERCMSRLEMLTHRLQTSVLHRLERENSRLDMVQRHLRSMDPDLLLKRGYSITMCQGRIVRNATDVQPGDAITTRVEKGEIKSQVL